MEASPELELGSTAGLRLHYSTNLLQQRGLTAVFIRSIDSVTITMKRSHGDMSDSASDQQLEGMKLSNSSAKSHQPKISRKIRACQECQSRKIKCGIEPGDAICARCQKLGLRCVVNKSLQTLLEDESEWKKDIENKTSQLQSAISDILQRLSMPNLDTLTPRSQSAGPNSPSGAATDPSLSPRPRNLPPTMSMARAGSPEPSGLEEMEHDTLSAPMTSLFEVTKLQNLRVRDHLGSSSRPELVSDFISQGRVSSQDAEELFMQFSISLNQYLYGGVVLVHDDLTSVRKSSSLLAAAIIAVTALHVRGKEDVFDAAYTEFLSLVSESMFDGRHGLDDIRAFCIGAFWLSDVSWKLSGHAVRIATELNLHQSFGKAIRGQVEHVERARLWYLLYVCDHQCSIAYGRPSVIQEDIAITCHETFLQVPGTTQADWRLQSQVAIFRILSRMFQQFGADSDKALSEAEFTALHAFNNEFDSWRQKWEPRLAHNKYVSNYPSRIIIMHWNFAKLQVNALALRGLSPRQAHLISDQRRDFANLAIAHALGTLSFILEDPSIRTAIKGIPLYLHTTVAYAAIFLLRVQVRWRPARLNLNMPVALNLIERVAPAFSQVDASERHLCYHISSGLRKLVAKYRKSEHAELDQAQTSMNHLGTYPAVNVSGPEDWSANDSGSDTMFGDMSMYSSFDNELLPPTFFDMVSQQMPG